MPPRESFRPRVGVPWRTAREEAMDKRAKMTNYFRAVERAGGDPVLISLQSSREELKRVAAELDAMLLTGSPADVDPAHFQFKRHPATEAPDAARERVDFTLLEQAMITCKPVLTICYGMQTLNVFLGGTLVQDIPSELGCAICHSPDEEELPGGAETLDAFHVVRLDHGRLLGLSEKSEVQVASWHHQSILETGRGLRVTARAPDGVVEAVEWTGDANWITGVQWHPERMPDDPLAQELFRALVEAAHAWRR